MIGRLFSFSGENGKGWELWQGDEMGDLRGWRRVLDGDKKFNSHAELIVFCKSLEGENIFQDLEKESFIRIKDGKVIDVTREVGWSGTQIKRTWEVVAG